MIELLKQALAELPDLIGYGGPEWNSLDIDYHEPMVKRVWIPWGPEGEELRYRLNVHKILPCEPSEALWHPHAWQSAVYILDGEYRMELGVTENGGFRTSHILRKGSFYAMDSELLWHYVAPVVPTYTVMLTGPPYPKHLQSEVDSLPKPPEMGPLSEDEIADLQTSAYLLLRSNKMKGLI